ncbi:MAG TPA: sigma factor-like helix-turn-helix DNA-binding protein, partial [Solirubrobacteraceae bacterium]|nr:sigma factor-like helix-turn-helix DNA-binding protein [Solirubrobacteraceae bacterium]
MSPLDALAPDQRLVVALLLRPGTSYDDVAGILGIPVEAVRARANAGLAALGPDTALPAEVTGPLADYLLQQQSASDAAATRRLLEESAPARAWSAGVAEALAPTAP